MFSAYFLTYPSAQALTFLHLLYICLHLFNFFQYSMCILSCQLWPTHMHNLWPSFISYRPLVLCKLISQWFIGGWVSRFGKNPLKRACWSVRVIVTASQAHPTLGPLCEASDIMHMCTAIGPGLRGIGKRWSRQNLYLSAWVQTSGSTNPWCFKKNAWVHPSISEIPRFGGLVLCSSSLYTRKRSCTSLWCITR
jgi:hypothetical protein